MKIKKIINKHDRAVVLLGTAVLPKTKSTNWDDLVAQMCVNPYFKDKTVIVECEPISSRGEITDILHGVRGRTINLIMYYTEKSYEYLLKNEPSLLSMIDILVDGEVGEVSKKVPFRFSDNQRIIDVVASLEQGCVVYHKLDVEI